MSKTVLTCGVAALALSLAACATTETAGGALPPPTAEAAPPAPTISPELAAAQEALKTNPLLAEWKGPYGGTPPFDQVKPELFPAALMAATAFSKPPSMQTDLSWCFLMPSRCTEKNR